MTKPTRFFVVLRPFSIAFYRHSFDFVKKPYKIIATAMLDTIPLLRVRAQDKELFATYWAAETTCRDVSWAAGENTSSSSIGHLPDDTLKTYMEGEEIATVQAMDGLQGLESRNDLHPLTSIELEDPLLYQTVADRDRYIAAPPKTPQSLPSGEGLATDEDSEEIKFYEIGEDDGASYDQEEEKGGGRDSIEAVTTHAYQTGEGSTSTSHSNRSSSESGVDERLVMAAAPPSVHSYHGKFKQLLQDYRGGTESHIEVRNSFVFIMRPTLFISSYTRM